MNEENLSLTAMDELERRCEADGPAELAAQLRAAAETWAGAPAVELEPGVEVSGATLVAIADALDLDRPFLERHPEALFQCLHERLYWHDAAEVAAHYPPGSEGPWTAEGPKLSALARRWRAEAPDRVWLAGRRPPPERLGEGGFLLRGSPEPAHSLALSRDGSRVAAGCWSHVAVWDVESRRLIAYIPTEEAEVRGLDFSPDGRLLATGSRDHTARVWDLEAQELLWEADDHEGQVTCVRFSPDGEALAVGNLGWTARVYDAHDGTELSVFRRHRQSVLAIDVSPDGARVVTGASDGTVRVWDIASGEELLRFGDCPEDELEPGEPHMGDTVASVAFSPDGTRVAATLNGVSVFPSDPGREPVSFRPEGAGCRHVEWLDDGRLAVDIDSGIAVCDAAGGELLTIEPTKPSEDVELFTRCHPGGHVARTLPGGGVRVWRLGEGSPARSAEPRPTGAGSPIRGLEVDAESGRVLVLRGSPYAPQLERLHLDGRLEPLALPDATLLDEHNRALSARSLRLAYWAEDYGQPPEPAVWDLAAGVELSRFSPRGAEGSVSHDKDLRFHPDGRRLLVRLGSSLQLWDALTGTLLGTLDWPAAEGERINEVAFTPDGEHLLARLDAVRGSDGALAVWSVLDGRLRVEARLGGFGLERLRVSPDGAHLAAARSDGSVFVYALAGGSPALRRPEGLSALAFAPRERTLALGLASGRIELWDWEQDKVLTTIEAHRGAVRGLAWNQRGLASASSRQTRVWDAATGELRAGPPEGTPARVLSELWPVVDADETRIYRADAAAPIARYGAPLRDAQILGGRWLIGRHADAEDTLCLLELCGTDLPEPAFEEPGEAVAPTPFGGPTPPRRPPPDRPGDRPKIQGFQRF